MKSKHYLKLLFVLICFNFFVTSCEQDETSYDHTSNEKNVKLTSKIISENDIPDVINYVKSKSDDNLNFSLKSENSQNRSQENLLIGTIQTDEITQVTNDASRSNFTFKVNKIEPNDEFSFINYIVKESPEGFYGYFLEYVPDLDWVKTTTNPNSLKDYTGEIRAYDRNGFYVGKNVFSNGNRIELTFKNPCTDDESDSGSGGGGSGSGGTDGGSGSGSGSGSGGGTGSGGGGSGGSDLECIVIDISYNDSCTCEIAVVYTCVDFFQDQKSKDNPLKNPCTDDCNLQNDCEYGFDSNCNCLPDEDEDENPNDGVIIDLEEYIIAFEIENRIISTELDPCSSNILNELKNLTQYDIANIIYRFDAPETAYSWEIKTETPLITPTNAAETDWVRDISNNPVDYSYLTHINPSYQIQATQVSIARTILHELLHTYLSSLVDDTILTGSTDVTAFPLLWSAIVNDTYNNNPNRLQHEIIGRRFITPIKDALKEWDGATQSDQFYEDMAWGALEGTSTFNTLFLEGSESRNRILNTNRAEDTNEPEEDVEPTGTSC